MQPIDVGTQRFTVNRSAASSPAPAPALNVGSTVTLADVATLAGRRVTAERLDAEFFADPNRILPMVADWTQDQLYMLANMFMGEGDRRGTAELLELLRWLCEPGGPDDATPHAVKVEFVTQTYDNGVFWHDEEIFLHCTDGTVEPYEWPEDHHQDDEWRAKDERYTALLADYSRANPPSDGDHLIVDLITGKFEHTSKWSQD
ncbi:hypothetical protein [Streptomyces sp. NPDC058751]|uniref:hypothetical protein n=1 Tax=Streptomyces sp. NPDC058751 TaxID=3346623 RepID=UPI0036CDE01D